MVSCFLSLILILSNVLQLHSEHGLPTATLEHPPNEAPFDTVSTKNVVKRSPLLQARVDSMQKEKGGCTEPVQIHNHIYHQPPTAGLGEALPLAAAHSKDKPLILEHCVAGEEMEIGEFVSVFHAPSSILAHFNQHAITGTHAFSHLTENTLKDMGFKIGEIIDLRRAVGLWAPEK